MTQFDKNNFCVNIQNEKDSPLLPKLKEWYRARTNNDWTFTSLYYGLKNGMPANTSQITVPIYTLAQLRQLMPEIWGDAVQVKIGDTVVTKRFEGDGWQKDMSDLVGKSNKVTQITTFAQGIYYEVHDWYWPASAVRLIPPDEQVQQWKPEAGEVVEVTNGKEFGWLKKRFIHTRKQGEHLCENLDYNGSVTSWLHIRPILTFSDKIQDITGNAEMTEQILKVVEDLNNLNSK